MCRSQSVSSICQADKWFRSRGERSGQEKLGDRCRRDGRVRVPIYWHSIAVIGVNSDGGRGSSSGRISVCIARTLWIIIIIIVVVVGTLLLLLLMVVMVMVLNTTTAASMGRCRWHDGIADRQRHIAAFAFLSRSGHSQLLLNHFSSFSRLNYQKHGQLLSVCQLPLINVRRIYLFMNPRIATWELLKISQSDTVVRLRRRKRRTSGTRIYF